LRTVRADRLVAIVLLLQARGAMSAGQLAGELEVSTRTILRDVEALGEGVRTQLWNAPAADDGTVELDLRFDSLDDARMQLMGLGTSITVLDPPALCDDLVRSATELLRAYAPDAVRR
jgi:predicted DNA-binding transcriptional regulator YafY